ncbi:hypothetical protein PV04_07662 [Phialophora macrospora]|uniref:AB hydrolase-1 domain-containing protein n=1 Tax=Phialophora macrospora TaxID=1851006 RepID=A0A0D2FZT8_9EURO|nr:hypothetical protein PV04_07662 [Phialophora macrospora]
MLDSTTVKGHGLPRDFNTIASNRSLRDLTMNTILELLTIGVFLLSPASAAPYQTTAQSSRPCVQLQVPVEVTANNSDYAIPRVDSNIDAVDLVLDTSTRSRQDMAAPLPGVLPIKQTFSISAQLCVPQGGSKSDILQVATHGLGFDKRYWDVELHRENYSYVDAALQAGYSILTYDRLSTGLSDKPDAYTVVQLPVEVEILKGLTTLARTGNLISASSMTSGRITPALRSYKPNKVVHVGHSLGSMTTMGFVSAYGDLTDGVLLTGSLISNQSGFIQFSTFGFEYAPENDPELFADRSSGYLVQGTVSAAQQLFLRNGTFEPELLEYADKIKQTGCVGELISGAAVTGRPATAYTGPVQFLVGENDFPACGGDCNGVFSYTTAKALFPAASNISAYLQPGTGHGLTISTNATAGYEVMFSYLTDHGL